MKLLYTLLFLIFFYRISAQSDTTDLLSLLIEEPTTEYTTAAFKTTRVVNGQSIENVAKGVLDVKINHRFGFFSGGSYEFFGLDQAMIRLGLDYGVTDRLMVGVGRNSYEKVVDGFLKYKILRQSSGKINMPISLSYSAEMDMKTINSSNPEINKRFWLRGFFTNQILIARKFSAGTTLQLMPTIVHRNYVATKADKNDIYLMGIAARQKLSKRIAVNLEYYYALPNQLSSDKKNSLSIGFDIETGGHVFQLFFVNSSGTDSRSYLTETTGSWGKGDVRLGFNISRVFTIVKPKE